MSAVTEDRQQRQPPTPDAVGERRERDLSNRRKLILRYASMPLFLAVAMGALYAYVQGQELDSIEQRILNQEFLVSRTLEHLQISLTATVIVILLAVPAGIVCTRSWAAKIRPFAISLANIGQATPSLGLIAIFVIAFTFLGGSQSVIAGLVAYAFLPILRNTIAGLEAVDPALIESAKGMGMNQRLVLRKIELPLAIPVMLAGIRVALILAVGTTTIAYLFPGAAALGQVIQTGFQLQRTPVLVTGALLAAGLALLVDYVAGLVEDLLRPKGL